MDRKVIAILAAEIGALAFLYLHLSCAVGGYGFPLDDSWIHSHFARNLAEGRGIVYNPGQHVTSTAPLYSLALAVLFAVTHSPVFSAMALGLALHFGSSTLIYAISRRLLVCDSLSAVAAICFAAVPRLAWGALSGMEVPLYVFLVTLGIYWHIRYRLRDGVSSYLPSLAFGLAALARPECAVFLVCSLAVRLIDRSQWPESGTVLQAATTVPAQVAVFAAVVAPVLLYNLASYDLPLPPAFYAKTRTLATEQSGPGLCAAAHNAAIYLGETVTVLQQDSRLLTLLLVPGLIGCCALVRRSGDRRAMILPLALIALPTAIALASPLGPHRSLAQMFCQHGRYSAYLDPLLVLIAILGLVELRRLTVKRPVADVLAGVLIASILATLAASNWRLAHRYAQEVRNINDMQVALGKWASGLPSGRIIAVNDAGAIAYFSGHRILDTVGVVNPEVVPYLRRHADRQIGLLQYLRERKPDYVVIFPTWYPEIARRRDILHPIRSVVLRHNVICGGREMVIYRATWH